MLDLTVRERFVDLAHKRTFSAKQTIIDAGAPPESLYLVVSGVVSVLVQDERGRTIVLAYLHKGDFFGEMGLFPDQHIRTAEVRARSATLVAEMDYTSFRAFAREMPDVMFELAGQLAARVRNTSRRLRDLTFLDVASRLARMLFELSQQPDSSTEHPDGMALRVPRGELARLCGCSREMVGRVLKQLEDDGLILLPGRAVVVLPGTGLSSYQAGEEDVEFDDR